MIKLPECDLPLYLRLGDTEEIHVGSLEFAGRPDEVQVDPASFHRGLAKALRLVADRIENLST